MPKSSRRNKTAFSTINVAAPDASSARKIADADGQAARLVAPSPLVDEILAPKTNALTVHSITDAFTLQAVAYILIGIAALLLRVVNLDARPLAPAETQTAVAAWQFLNGNPVGAFPSPLLFTLDWIAFLLFGAFDLTARGLPAALGAFIVFVPLLARNALGRTGAVLASLLLAFSPTLVFFARNLAGADLAVGGASSALILFWNYREGKNTRALYAGAMLAALALTADATAYAILFPGAVYFAVAWIWSKRGVSEPEAVDLAQDSNVLQNPYVRAGALFALTYVLAATTFLLNRDGLGVAFNLLGAWLAALSNLGALTTPLNLLLVYEPLTTIFGLAGAVLALTLRGQAAPGVGLLRMFAFAALFALVWYSLGSDKQAANVVAIALPLILLAGWFIGNLVERAYADIRTSGGLRSMLSGEMPIFLLLLFLTTFIYFQVGAFLQQTRFLPALDAFYQLLNSDPANTSLVAAFVALALITIPLLVVFIGLSALLVGAARTTTLLAFTILVILSLGLLRATWLLNFSADEPLRELVAPVQTPLAMRDLVRDLEWHSQIRHGDRHEMLIVADEKLGAVGHWYLRNFSHLEWTNQIASGVNAEAVVSPAPAPPPGDWMGQRYRVQADWLLTNAGGLDLWKWFMFRQGGGETWQTTMLWLPTIK